MRHGELADKGRRHPAAAALVGALIGAGGVLLVVKKGPTGSAGPAGEIGATGPPGPSGAAAVTDLQSAADDLDSRVSSLECSVDDPGETLSDLDSRTADLELQVSDVSNQLSSLCIASGAGC